MPGKRYLRKAICAIALFAACGLVFSTWAYYQSNKELNEAIAAADLDDPNWRMEQLIERRKQVSDAENSAMVIQAGVRLIPRVVGSQQCIDWTIAVDELRVHPQCRANEQQLDAMLRTQQLYGPAMVAFNKLKDMPNGRYPITYVPGYQGVLLPHVTELREATNVLELETYRLVETGDFVESAKALIGCINTARSIGDEPFRISGSIRLYTDISALSPCERFLAQLDADEATLARIQTAIEAELKEQILIYALRCERAFYHGFLDYLKANPSQISTIYVSQVNADIGSKWLAYLPGTLTKSHAELIKHFNDAIRIAQLPLETQWNAVVELDKKQKNHSVLSRLLYSNVTGLLQTVLRHQAHLRCIQTLFAAERYRIRHKSWPESLEDLVADKLISTVPLDPYDGKPLRWKKTDDGRMVYSIGPDRIDQGGRIDRMKFDGQGNDFGYQLFDVDKRRQPARPVKPKEPAESGAKE